MVYLESYGVADAHDGAINGSGMAGHVKICRQWDQLFNMRVGDGGEFLSHATSSTITIALLHSQPFYFGNNNVRIYAYICNH
jgi:hypothetical protein